MFQVSDFWTKPHLSEANHKIQQGINQELIPIKFLNFVKDFVKFPLLLILSQLLIQIETCDIETHFEKTARL